MRCFHRSWLGRGCALIEESVGQPPVSGIALTSARGVAVAPAYRGLDRLFDRPS